jgi:hypothetical protein
LAQNHIEKIKKANSYQSSETFINDSLKSQFGSSVSVGDFITDQADRCKLYSIFAQWREKLLTELGIQVPDLQNHSAGENERV